MILPYDANPRPDGIFGKYSFTMYFATDDSATSNPSLSSSPWMRGAPQSGFSMLIFLINARRSDSICGRPPPNPTSNANNRKPSV